MTAKDDLDMPPEVDWSHSLALLDSYIADSLAGHPRPVRKRLREVVDLGQYLVRTRFHLGADGEPVPSTLTYCIDLPVYEEDGETIGWATLCTVHWTRLELTAEHVARELAATLRQQAAGRPAHRRVRHRPATDTGGVNDGPGHGCPPRPGPSH